MQKRIYHSLDGSKECYWFDDEYLEHIGWIEYLEHIGWWIGKRRKQFSFDITAPVAHLPATDEFILHEIFTRLDNCHLPTRKSKVQNSQSNQVASADIKLTLLTGSQYTRLITLLVNEDWQAADLETQRLMFGSSLGLMDWRCDAYQQMQQLSSEHLRIIDQLWVKYSHGGFGFSVQRDIWERVNGHIGDFARVIGWVSNDENDMYGVNTAIFDEDVNFSLSAPIGHLPCFIGNYSASGDTLLIGYKTYIFLVDFGTNSGTFVSLISHGNQSNALLSKKERMEYAANRKGNYDEILYLDMFFKRL